VLMPVSCAIIRCTSCSLDISSENMQRVSYILKAAFLATVNRKPVLPEPDGRR
jgi:hypothetical protein